MNVPSLKGSQMLTLAYFIGILVLLFIVYKVLSKIGLVKTAADKKEEKQTAEAVSSIRSLKYFEPLYLKDKLDTYQKLGKTAQFYAAQLSKAMSGFGTDEETIFSVFGKLKSRENIAEVASYYLNDYNESLQTDLLNELSEDELKTLSDIINKLPVK